jgi:glycosyltransferase involved in cell wall biosynthesis
MSERQHILINGLSVGSGGGYTVARELLRHVALARPEWVVTLAVTEANPLHEGLRRESLPANASLFWAPASTSHWLARGRYENTGLRKWAKTQNVTRLLQLNGMVPSSFDLPTLAHNQDPWPYRPEAWENAKAPYIAFLKRRAHRRAFKKADFVGFTSDYLRQLMQDKLGLNPRASAVFYNGLPQAWIDRTFDPPPDLSGRPIEILSVSNVSPYKRQDLVIKALPELAKRPGLEGIKYTIAGHCSDDERARLMRLAHSLGTTNRVTIEGRVSDERVADLLGQARAFVLMSVCESFGIPAVEAMSRGVPVVTSDCCAMPEVCGDAAELSPVDDINALVENIHNVLTDVSKSDELQKRGLKRVRKYNWTATASAMAEALERIG